MGEARAGSPPHGGRPARSPARARRGPGSTASGRGPPGHRGPARRRARRAAAARGRSSARARSGRACARPRSGCRRCGPAGRRPPPRRAAARHARGRAPRSARATGPPRRTTRTRRRRGPARGVGSGRPRRALVQPIRGRSSKTSTVPTTSPRMPTTPLVGWIWAEHSCISVVLPAPLGPSTTQRSSSSTAQSTWSSRVACPRLTLTSASSSTAVTSHHLAIGPAGLDREPTRCRARAADPVARGARVYALRVRALPTSAVLCAWLDAVRAGHAGPDDLEQTVRGADPRHLVVGLPTRATAGRRRSRTWPWATTPPLELHQLPAALDAPPRLALPVPGDLVGLGGPRGAQRGRARGRPGGVAGAIGLVPETGRAHRGLAGLRRPSPAPYVGERESAIELAHDAAEVTGGSSTSTSPRGSPTSPTC